ncbi:MAG: hypothetical protein RL130_696 [Actinomycetota bacterium]
MFKKKTSLATASLVAVFGFSIISTPTAFAVASISVGSISSNPVAGTVATKTIPVTTLEINDMSPLTLTWVTDSSGTTNAAGAPTGLIKNFPMVSSNAATISINVANTAVAGTYYLKVSYGMVVTPVVVTITVDAAAPSGSSSGSSASEIAAAAAKAAAEQVAKAKASLVENIKAGKPITASDLNSADIHIESSAAADRVNAKLAELPAGERSDLAKIRTLVQKENLVEKLSSSATQLQVKITDLLRVGLLAPDYKNKSEVVRTLLGNDPASLTSIEKVEAAVKKAQADIQARKDRLVATLTRIQTRK